MNDCSVGYVQRSVLDIPTNPGCRRQLEMTGSTNITMNSAGNINVDRSNIAIHFCVLGYVDSGFRLSGADYVKLNMPVNVDAVGESQEVSVNVG